MLRFHAMFCVLYSMSLGMVAKTTGWMSRRSLTPIHAVSTGHSFPWARRSMREPDHSLLSSAKIKNELSHTSTVPRVFVYWYLITRMGNVPLHHCADRLWDPPSVNSAFLSMSNTGRRQVTYTCHWTALLWGSQKEMHLGQFYFAKSGIDDGWLQWGADKMNF
jgi:hypothetical protein